MPAERTSMRQVREVLRLKLVGGVATREIARRIGVTPSTVRNTLKRFQASGLGWPLPKEMTDGELESKLFAAVGTKQGHRRHFEPDWTSVHRELRRKHVTLAMLWEEYIEANPEGYRYSRFCGLYRSWEAKLSVTMRQTYMAGDKLFVDYAGDTVPVIVDRLSGEVRQAQIFVAVMGASNFTYVEATWTQTLGDWIGAHTRAFTAIGGVPRLIVPDNAKVAVIKACLYEPQINRTYAEMATHYGTAVLPTRPRRPRDKAKVVSSETIGWAGVDWARLMFADVDALGHWRHNIALDRMADCGFWGREMKLLLKPLGLHGSMMALAGATCRSRAPRNECARLRTLE
jgi:transposase